MNLLPCREDDGGGGPPAAERVVEGASRWQDARSMCATPLSQKRAKTLRRSMSPPEVLLWVRLRRRSDQAPVFRRQHPFGFYILDFYCPAAKLAVEIDGYSHSTGDHPERDERRERWLRSQGLEVLHLSASDVMADPDETADGVLRLAISRVTRQGL